MTVLIVPEDFRKDQFVLKASFREAPCLIGQAARDGESVSGPAPRWRRRSVEAGNGLRRSSSDTVERRDIIVLCIDRDGRAGRRQRLNQLEETFGERFLGAEAWEEIETWVLAGLTPSWELELGRRASRGGRQRAVLRRTGETARASAARPDGGRSELAEEAASRIDGIRRKCSEDFDALAQRIEVIVRPN